LCKGIDGLDEVQGYKKWNIRQLQENWILRLQGICCFVSNSHLLLNTRMYLFQVECANF
jgi:hypothetical protein